MKFVYAVLAISIILSSCSNETEPTTQTELGDVAKSSSVTDPSEKTTCIVSSDDIADLRSQNLKTFRVIKEGAKTSEGLPDNIRPQLQSSFEEPVDISTALNSAGIETYTWTVKVKSGCDLDSRVERPRNAANGPLKSISVSVHENERGRSVSLSPKLNFHEK